MRKISFNENWTCAYADGTNRRSVAIPHDAMLEEERVYTSYGHNNGFFKGYDYVYEKDFSLTEEWKGKKLVLEFEGVYHRARVFLNGKELAYAPNGYIGFFVDLTDEVKKENHLVVTVKGADQPNSRWYTGVGIYRPVWLWISEKKNYIPLSGVRVETLSIEPARIRAEVPFVGKGNVSLTVKDGEHVVYTEEKKGENGKAVYEFTLENAKLWSDETPFLYKFTFAFGQDEIVIPFGIRALTYDLEKGFLVNGKRTILRGCCIHADNGLLGAKEYDEVAYRKIKLLKEVGYNAVRSAHQACSKALLKACDELGMYMLDEYADMWYIHKNKYDYASFVSDRYEEDIRSIVEKDFNHPSVIMYSSGNEVAETSQKKGIAFTKTLTDTFHRYDPTRGVTCGINIFFNFLSSIGMGFYSEKKTEEEKPVVEQKPKKKKAVGSEFFNNLAGFFGSDTMKIFAWLPFCDWVTKKAFANMDVAGYNYGITRYRKDHRKYKNRWILGSETFITDAYDFWKKAKKYPRIMGDFAWAGIDYIGEVGLGSLDYADYAKDFDKTKDWLTASSGCLDITGASQGHTAYTQVVYDQRDIAIAVQPADHSGEGHMTSAWRKIHAFESWSWNGCDGHSVLVEVYTKAHSVGLFLNGKKIGLKKNKNCRVKFKTSYAKGEIVAIGYDKHNQELYRTSLKSAGEETILSILPEEQAKKGKLLPVRLRYTDENGTRKPLARGDIKLDVKGGKLLGFGSACPYNERGYLTNVSDTYYGEAFAYLLVEEDTLSIKAESRYATAERTINAN